MKITICGSMTAAKKMVEVGSTLKKFNHEIILPKFTEDYAQMETLDKIHEESAHNKIQYDLIKGYFDEIKNSDCILVINENKNNTANYIGGNTFLEIGFAHILDKKIFLLNPIPETSYEDEIKAMQPIIINGNLELIR